jgi:hypothetical protein
VSIVHLVVHHHCVMAAIDKVSRVLHLMCNREMTKNDVVSPFDFVYPIQNVKQYVKDFLETMDPTTTELICTLLMINRLGIPLQAYNIGSILPLSLMIASKYVEDTPYNNAELAYVTGISLKTFNYLEVQFCYRIGFDMVLSFKDFYDLSICIYK